MNAKIPLWMYPILLLCIFFTHPVRTISDVELADIDLGGSMQWLQIWGGSSLLDRGLDVACDDAGNIFVIGIFSNEVDFDPGSGTSNDNKHNAFYLSKFNTAGGFQWVRTWDGADIDVLPSIVVDRNGSIYTAGWFNGEVVDLEPGPGESIHSARQPHTFLNKFDSSGNFQWVKTFGGDWWTRAYDVDVDGQGNIFLGGCFGGRPDMDPGPEDQIIEADGRIDGYLMKLNPTGELIWVNTFGGSGGGEGIERDTVHGVRARGDGSVYITGGFNKSADFNPRGDRWFLSSEGKSDVFLAMYDPDGIMVWVKRWGCSNDDFGVEVDYDGEGNIYAAGFYGGRTNFNPPSRFGFLPSLAAECVYLSKFNSDGEYVWTSTWGAIERETNLSMDVNESGEAFLAGRFSQSGKLEGFVPEESFAESAQLRLVMVGFDPDGNPISACPLEGSGQSFGKGVTVDPSGNILITGMFDHVVDFDPEFGWENIDERVSVSNNLQAFLMKFVMD